jgi:proline iminopeptidase
MKYITAINTYEMKWYSILICLILIISCQSKNKLQPGEGFIQVKGGKVWYRIVGCGSKTPLLLLHGGPGVPSYYLNPMSALANDRSVIFIDQLGCGRSDRITDTSLLNVNSFVEQLEEVRNALHLHDFYLYGHSWGTMLAMDYYLAHPQGIKAIIFASPCLDIPRWQRDADTLVAALPDSIQQTIRRNEANKTYKDSSYQNAIGVYYQHHLTITPPSANDDSTQKGIAENVYAFMWGPSEFTATGNLKNYNRTSQLKDIKVPVLYVCGDHDEARPVTVKYFQSLTPGSKLAVISNSAHLTMKDNTSENDRVIAEFLNEVDHK